MRYVVLLHNCPDGSAHYDLMFEEEQALATYRFAALPDGKTNISLERIHDHDKRFLTYEGPVNKGKGAVTRVDSGVYEQKDNAVAFSGGSVFTGSYIFAEDGDSVSLSGSSRNFGEKQ